MQNALFKRPRFLTFIHEDNMDNFTWFNVRFLAIFGENAVKKISLNVCLSDKYFMSYFV